MSDLNTDTDFYTAQETRLRQEWGDVAYDQIMLLPDNDEAQERAIRAIAVGGDRANTENIFFAFQAPEDVELLISALQSALETGELTASVRGRVMTFGEWCDANPDIN